LQVTARINAMRECIRRLNEAFTVYRTEITAAPGTGAALPLDDRRSRFLQRRAPAPGARHQTPAAFERGLAKNAA
jgi:hypothetical protein